MPETTVAIVSKPSNPAAALAAPELCAYLVKRGYKVVTDPETAVYAPGYKTVERSALAETGPSFVVVLGGDGTLLAAARAVAKAKVPLLAVNLGSLGFLTEVKLEELYASIEAVEKNQCSREARSMIRCTVMRRDREVEHFDALNDIVVSKRTIARMAEVDIFANGIFVANYKADGVIISTPTGSTAYSLAAGGPVLEPNVGAIVITPISPHALTNRPLVLRDSSEVKLVVKGTTDEAYLTVDGQCGMPVLEGDQIICGKSDYQVQLLRLPGRTFFDVLRTKLKWGER
jgi:NAD+ kinase